MSVPPPSPADGRHRRLPFAHLNLRRNPFGELPLEDWPALTVLDVDRLLATLRSPPRCVQLLGDKGRGKTTHLLLLRARLAPEAPYVHFPEDAPAPPVPEGEPILFLDETQRLSRRQRARLFAETLRRGAALAIGTHEDHRAELTRAGLPVESHHVGDCSPGRLEAIIASRIEAARRGPGELPRVGEAAVARLVDRFGDDVRGATFHLYEVFQTLTEIGDVEV